jgi:hypothetical protein
MFIAIEVELTRGRLVSTFRRNLMPDDRSRRESPDRERIDIHDEHEVRNWAMSLKVTPEQLKAAVSKVGTSADQVRQYLRGK